MEFAAGACGAALRHSYRALAAAPDPGVNPPARLRRPNLLLAALSFSPNDIFVVELLEQRDLPDGGGWDAFLLLLQPAGARKESGRGFPG